LSFRCATTGSEKIKGGRVKREFIWKAKAFRYEGLKTKDDLFSRGKSPFVPPLEKGEITTKD